jgi:hypothetical protein
VNDEIKPVGKDEIGARTNSVRTPAAPKTNDQTRKSERAPAAGPRTAPEMSNPEATPGAGTLQRPGADDDMDSTR